MSASLDRSKQRYITADPISLSSPSCSVLGWPAFVFAVQDFFHLPVLSWGGTMLHHIWQWRHIRGMMVRLIRVGEGCSAAGRRKFV